MKTVRATKNIAALVVQSKATKLKEEGAHNKKEDAQWKERASYAQWEEFKTCFFKCIE